MIEAHPLKGVAAVRATAPPPTQFFWVDDGGFPFPSYSGSGEF